MTRPVTHFERRFRTPIGRVRVYVPLIASGCGHVVHDKARWNFRLAEQLALFTDPDGPLVVHFRWLEPPPPTAQQEYLQSRVAVSLRDRAPGRHVTMVTQ